MSTTTILTTDGTETHPSWRTQCPGLDFVVLPTVISVTHHSGMSIGWFPDRISAETFMIEIATLDIDWTLNTVDLKASAPKGFAARLRELVAANDGKRAPGTIGATS